MNTMTALFASLVLASTFAFGDANSGNVEQVPVPTENGIVGEQPELIGPPPAVEYQSKGGEAPQCLSCD